MRFSIDSRHRYVINELGNTVSAFAYDMGRGFLLERDSVPTLPAPVCGVLAWRHEC